MLGLPVHCREVDTRDVFLDSDGRTIAAGSLSFACVEDAIARMDHVKMSCILQSCDAIFGRASFVALQDFFFF